MCPYGVRDVVLPTFQIINKLRCLVSEHPYFLDIMLIFVYTSKSLLTTHSDAGRLPAGRQGAVSARGGPRPKGLSAYGLNPLAGAAKRLYFKNFIYIYKLYLT